jgi:hypothetical protein
MDIVGNQQPLTRHAANEEVTQPAFLEHQAAQCLVFSMTLGLSTVVLLCPSWLW